MLRRTLLACAAASATPKLVFAASPQDGYPNRPIRMVVPFPSGQVSDTMARVIADHLKLALNQPVVVENRPGQGGSLAAAAFTKALPDGYSLLVGATAAFASNKFVFSNVTYDPLKDFQPVTMIATYPVVLTVRANVPAKDISELVGLMRTQPGQLSYGSSGFGTVSHVVMEALQVAVGGKATHVPFQGSGPAMVALLGGHVDIFVDSLFGAMPQIEAGRVRALAVPGTKRHPALPNVPTLTELGYPGADREFWGAIFVPAGTPRPLVDRLNAEVVAVLRKPEVRAKLNTVDILVSTPEEAAKRIQDDYLYWGDLLKRANIKAQ